MVVDFYDLDKEEKELIIDNSRKTLKGRLDFVSETNESLDAIRNVSINGFADFGRGYVLCEAKENDEYEGEIEEGQIMARCSYGWIGLSVIDNELEKYPEDPFLVLIKSVTELGYATNKTVLFVAHAFEHSEQVSCPEINKTVTNFPHLIEWDFLDFGSRRQEIANAELLEDCLQKEVLIANQPIPRKQPEKQKELDLYSWMRRNKIEVERQVATSQKHRIDLWIPGKLMIELKQAKVTGDDVCQAIDYYSVYRKPIVLVGTSLSAAASRGVEAFVRLHGEDSIQFVTCGAIKPYLKGLLGE